MSTTIKVSNETKRLLDIKKQVTNKTYDEIVQQTLREQLSLKEHYGKYSLGGWNKKEDRMNLDERH